MDTPACTAEHCTRQLRPWELEARMVICSPCLGQMRTWLEQIPAALIVLRDGSMQRERTGAGGRVGTRTAPLPCREEVLNLIGPAASMDVHDPHGDQCGVRPLIGTLSDWVRVVLEERLVDGPDAWTETALAAWLQRQLGWVSQQGWACETHRELRDLVWQIRGIARIDIRTRPVPRPCPNDKCGQLLLTQTDGDQYTRCGGCLGVFTQQELNDDAARRAETAAA